jgi:hypothetical protein
MSAMPTEPRTSQLFRTAADKVIGVRIVRYGERFGKDYQYTHDSAVPVIEFRLGGVSPRSPFIAAFMPTLFENLSPEVRFSPDGSVHHALPLEETDRLFRWLEEMDVISTELL